MVLITGATGNSGGELLRLFQSREWGATCMIRRDEAREKLESHGFATVYGNFDDRASLDRALEGQRRAYLVCTPDERLFERESRFIDACRDAQLERLVLLSGYPCYEVDSPILGQHAKVEDHLRSSGLDYTILRPLGFMQTIYWMSLPMIEKDSVMVGSTGDGKNAVIDLRDVAQLAFDALVGAEHSRQTYDLTGPEALSMAEMAEILGRHLGREIRYIDVEPDEFANGMRDAGVPDVAIRHILAVFGAIRAGELDVVQDTLPRIGISPHSWDRFAEDVAAGRSGAATSFAPPAKHPP